MRRDHTVDDEIAVLSTFAATAVNCFTGNLAELARRLGKDVDESGVLERGNGYLFRTGRDEWDYPEYTFSVEAVGLRGIRALGTEARGVAIAQPDWASQLRSWGSLIEDRRRALRFYSDKLELDPTRDEAMEFLRKRHAQFLPKSVAKGSAEPS
jgi:hypothetical protein